MRAIVASLALSLTILAAKSEAATFLLGVTFATDSPTTQTGFGTGILSYEAENPLADGSYAWTSLTNAEISIALGSFIFSHDDLVTSAPTIYIEVRGDGFFFSNSEISGSTYTTSSPSGGAAEFVKNDFMLSTQPVGIGSDASVRFSLSNSDSSTFHGGVYSPATPAPEPSAALTTMVGFGAALFRRRKGF